MASTFEDRFTARGWPRIAAEFGVAASYVADGATTTDLTVVLHRDLPDQADLTDGQRTVTRARGTIEVAVSALAAATIGGRFTVGAETWVIDSDEPPYVNDGVWRCRVSRMSAFSRGERRQR